MFYVGEAVMFHDLDDLPDQGLLYPYEYYAVADDFFVEVKLVGLL